MTRWKNWDEFQEALEKQKEKISGGGAAAIARTEVAFGYPVFASGLDVDERFFPAAPNDTEENAEAKKAAQKLAREHGVDPDDVRYQLYIIYRADGAIKLQNDQWVDAGWSGDMTEVAPYWTATQDVSALMDIHVPAMKENNIMHGWSGWAKIGYQRDPYKVSLGEAGKTAKGPDGEPRYPIVRYIEEVYSTKQEAYSAVGYSDDIPGFESDVPDGYSPESWDKMKPAIKEALAEGQAPAKVASDYGVDVSDVTKLM